MIRSWFWQAILTRFWITSESLIVLRIIRIVKMPPEAFRWFCHNCRKRFCHDCWRWFWSPHIEVHRVYSYVILYSSSTAEPGSAAPSVKNPMIGFYKISGMDRESSCQKEYDGQSSKAIPTWFRHQNHSRIVVRIVVESPILTVANAKRLKDEVAHLFADDLDQYVQDKIDAVDNLKDHGSHAKIMKKKSPRNSPTWWVVFRWVGFC